MAERKVTDTVRFDRLLEAMAKGEEKPVPKKPKPKRKPKKEKPAD